MHGFQLQHVRHRSGEQSGMPSSMLSPSAGGAELAGLQGQTLRLNPPCNGN